MYQIKHHKDSNILELQNPENGFYAKIYLDKGASLQELSLLGHHIIVDLDPLKYSDTYASSILFPFANRIKDGQYTFDGEIYQLEKNQIEEQNALHGLVYNKTFEVFESNTTSNKVSLRLKYIEESKSKGFPFTYEIYLDYTFTFESLILGITVKNTDVKIFPFTLGWHPYFFSNNLSDSSLEFESVEKMLLGDRNITIGSEPFVHSGPFKILDKKLDDCWKLESKTVKFNTPKYQFVIESSDDNNFLQVYVPPKDNTVAIEPTTGVSDSLNNGIGLKTLKPNETYKIEWTLNLIDN